MVLGLGHPEQEHWHGICPVRLTAYQESSEGNSAEEQTVIHNGISERRHLTDKARDQKQRADEVSSFPS